ncbi:MAG TPA: LysR family transcriptional regulator [Rhizomicrobium sp.]|jgi:DNA-binding transcriptional LysR family regulator|nr:LysR family transcriptional regulator [Rhizomicrobium sp.]
MQDIDFNNIRRMDGSLLLVFHELLREKRATTVAHRLGLSQSAISHALTRLRDIFGDPLFVRKPHGLEPTRRALELKPRVEALLQLADETLARERKFVPAESKRRFLLTAPEFVTALIGARLVESFRKTAPHASVILESAPHQAAFQALKRGEIDVALGRFGTVPPGLVSSVLFEDRYCIVARRGHPKFKGRVTVEAYETAGHIFAISEGATEEEESNTSAALLAAVPRWLTVLVMVAASDGIGTVPLRLAERQAKMLGLQVIKAPYLQNRITVSAVRRADVRDEGADWFLEQIRAAVR